MPKELDGGFLDSQAAIHEAERIFADTRAGRFGAPALPPQAPLDGRTFGVQLLPNEFIDEIMPITDTPLPSRPTRRLGSLLSTVFHAIFRWSA